MVLTNADFDVKKEAAWAISNATSGGSPQQIKYLVAQGCIEPLCNLLSVHDNRIVSVALEGLENILRVGEKEKETAQSDQNEFARLVEAAGGLDRIEALQQHTNQEVYEKAVRLLEVFFAADEEEDIEGLAPQTTGNQFGFGVQTAPDGGFNFGGASATDATPFDSQPTPPEPRW
jgi:importin subunit alpha-6/7